MERRAFLGRTATAAAAIATLGWSALLTGCNVMSDLLNWIPVGLSAVSSVLTLLSGAGIVLGPAAIATIGLIQAAFADLKLAIVEYQSTTPPPAGALAKVDTFLADLVSNLGNALEQLPTGASNVITLVVGLVELTLSTIEGFIAQVPATVAMTRTKGALARVIIAPRGQPAIMISARPKNKLTRRSFIHDFNALTTAAGHKEANLPESLIQHL